MANADVAKLIAILELKDLFSDKISKAERNLTKFESRSTKAGRQIGLGVLRGAAVAASGITAFGAVFAKGLSAASDLSETVSKTGVVFGKNAKQVLAFGHDSAQAMGLSENAALAAASTYGNLFVSLGLTTDKAAKMSTSMVKLAGDLASFNNASPEDTLLAIQAGLVGETEPLRRYGINLNDATLRQEAMRLGLTKTTKEVLPPAIKAQAAYSLILKQSGTAQGDFQRTSGGMANQIRILKANFTDMLATLAAPALPGVAKIFQNINKEIKANQPAIAALGEKIGGLFTDDNIKAGFGAIKEGFQVAKDAAPAIADAAKITGSALKIAVDAFKSLPKEVQQIAIAGLAVNKLTGGLVTNIAGGIIDTVGKSFLQRGGTPANPLFVADVSGGIGKALPGAAAVAGGGAAAAALPVAVIAASIAGPIVAQQKISSDQQINAYNLVSTNVAQQLTGGASLDQLKTSLSAVDKGINDIQSNPLNMIVGGEALKELQLNRIALQGGIQKKLDEIALAGRDTIGGFDQLPSAASAELQARRIEAAENRTGNLIDAAGKTIGKQVGETTWAVRATTKALKDARGPKEIGAAVKSALTNLITKGLGGSGGAANVLKQLKAQLKNTHDPATAAILRSAIGKVEHKLAARKIVEDQLKKADQIWKSNKTNAEKIRELKDVQKAIGTRNAIATRRVQEKIDSAKKAQVAASNRTTRAVREKQLAVTLTNIVNTAISIRDELAAQQTRTNYYNYATGGGRG